jgi:sugar-specific transcriptional regulator TrmB
LKQQELIEKLKSLGFKEYESRVFLVLLKGNLMSASDIARESKVIRNSIYDVLKSFVEKGYCNEVETNTVLQYRIIDPAVILDKIEKDYHDKYHTKVSLLKDTFTELNSFYNKDNNEDDEDGTNIELIRGFNKHRVAKYMDLYKNAKREVLGMYQLKGLVAEEFNEIAANFISKGGVIKSIYRASLDFKILSDGKLTPASENDLTRVIRKFQESGEQVRLSEVKIPNITIFDRETIFINLTDKKIPKHKQADIIIKNPDYAEHMADLFKFYWDQGLTVDEYEKTGEK